MNREEIKKTLCLPKTSFPLKNNRHGEIEKEIRIDWEKKQIYQKLLAKNKNSQPFILHSGPTYANGKIHLGHVLNYTLKDVIIRYHASRGHRAPFILGWDMHGLPIEHRVLQINQGKELTNIREVCAQYAREQMDCQKEELKKIGLFTNYELTYNTQNKQYEAKQIRIFAELVRKNLVYRGWKPIYWSCSHATALAENEIEYMQKEDYSLYFFLSLIDTENILGLSNVHLLIWTTQPWTIPANQLVAIKTHTVYSLIEWKEKFCLVATSRFQEISWLKEAKIISSVSGEKLINLKYYHPYRKELTGKIVDGSEAVDETEGSGILHCAPAFGIEDFTLATKARILINCPLNEQGYFTSEIGVPELIGKHYQEANKWVVSDLEKKAKIAYKGKFIHSYPHDWRDKSPLIYRLTEQWFINIKAIKQSLLTNIETVKWHPSWTKEKMISVMTAREDWCISRQRKWGVPIPVLFNEKTPILIPEIIDYVADIFEKFSSNCWFEGSILFELQAKFPQLVNEKTKLGTDIMDVWFDSGVSHLCVLLEKNGF